MTNSEALKLRKGTDVLVRRATSKRLLRAYVTGTPSQHGRFVLVPFSFYRPGSTDTIGRLDHYAQVGVDQIEPIPTIPCGWCDAPVEVQEDRGQIVYCSDLHSRLDTHIPDAEGNL